MLLISQTLSRAYLSNRERKQYVCLSKLNDVMTFVRDSIIQNQLYCHDVCTLGLATAFRTCLQIPERAGSEILAL